MVITRGEAPPPPRPWEDAPEVDYRLYKNKVMMARSYDSTIVTMKRLILRESANEPEGTQFVTEKEPIETADGKLYLHKIPQLPTSKHKYFIILMHPPPDLGIDDIPIEGEKPVKFLFSFYNLYLIGFSYDDKIWNIFDDAMVEGVCQESRDKFIRTLGFKGDYKTIKQNYLKLGIGFNGQCETYNTIIGVENNKTSDEELIRALCRTTVGLPESTRFAFLAQFHLRSFHSGNLDAVLDMMVLEGEEYKNFSVHLTKWGTYSTISKNGIDCFNVDVIPTLGIKSFSGLLNFVAVATNKKYDEENKPLEHAVAKKDSTGDVDDDKKGGNQGQDEHNKHFQENEKNDQDDGNTWFYQAPMMPYVPQGRQHVHLDSEAVVDTCGVLEIDRKTCPEELSWTLLLQYFVEAGAIAVRRLHKKDSCHVAKATGASRVTTFADMEREEAFDPSFLGHADEVGERRISDDEIILVKGTKNKSVVSVLLQGANDFILDVIEQSLHDALFIAKRTLGPNMVAAGGGGAVDAAALYACLENMATSLGSREQLAIAEFAKSLLITPKLCQEPFSFQQVCLTCMGHAGGQAAAFSVYLENRAITVGSREQLAIAELAESLPKVDDGPTLEGPWESPGRGGGSVEAAALYACLENMATALGSREQLAIDEFTESSPEVDDEPTPEGPWESPGMDKARLVEYTSHPLCGPSILTTNLDAQKWYADMTQEDLEQHDHFPLVSRLGVVS